MPTKNPQSAGVPEKLQKLQKIGPQRLVGRLVGRLVAAERITGRHADVQLLVGLLVGMQRLASAARRFAGGALLHGEALHIFRLLAPSPQPMPCTSFAQAVRRTRGSAPGKA